MQCLGPVCLFFFFSSRRRHTRCSRDWSSDVCSSDLCFVVSHSARGIVAPAGLAKHEAQFLVEMMRKVTYSKGWAEYAAKNMMTVKFLGGADYAKFLAEERANLTAALNSM